MRIAIIQFPGSNCERETQLAVQRAGMQAEPFLWNENPARLSEMDGFVLVGGFSYEDRSRAGIIAALDPIMQHLKAQSELGKPILGICNGAQILVESGLVPGVENNKVVLALTENKRIKEGKILGTGYYNDWIYLRLCEDYQRNAFTQYLSAQDILHIPIAHAQGRFVLSDALLTEINLQGLGLFRYCDAQGQIVDEFPINPNGSVANMAAITNKAGNVLAMMPHPERTTNGDAIFRSMHDYIVAQKAQAKPPVGPAPIMPLAYYPRQFPLATYQPDTNAEQYVVRLSITDNQAATVAQTLHQLGIDTPVHRYSHWEIQVEDPAVIDMLLATGVLVNDRKEYVVKPAQLTGHLYLVRSKENLEGRAIQQSLENFFHLQGIKAIYLSTLWQFSGKDINIERLLQTNIIHNPYSHDCYRYKSALLQCA